MNAGPYIFDEFFASGKEESISPFLTADSRGWGKNLPLKGALIASGLLLLTFLLSFINPIASYFTLAGVYFLVGTPALLDTIEDLREMEINIDVLMTLAALLSIVIGSGMEGALLLVLFELSAALENMVTQKTKGAILSLRRLSPKTVLVPEADGSLVERAIREISIGTRILIKAGDVIPLDGIVVQGSSFVNLVHLTGETEPLSKRTGDAVQAGAYNLDGSLLLEVQRTSADSTLTRIINLITQAQEAKPRLQRLFDKFGKGYSITIIGLSLFFALSLPYFLSLPYLGVEGSIYRALTFLIAASPCALIIATPTAYLSAISSCAKKGIILKGGAILDAIASSTVVAFDKTGTLTTGQLTCAGIDTLIPGPFTKEEAIEIAAGLERHAHHPIGNAITALCKNPLPIENFSSVPGFGLMGEVRVKGITYPVRIGHPDFIGQVLSKEEWIGQLGKWETQNTFLLIGKTLFVFHFTDQLRPHAAETLQTLREELGLSLLLLTGDHTENAQVVGKALQIDTIHANLRPEDKLKIVAELSHEKGLIMVGDGVNDAPALARATVGISMGKIGSATAVDASDVVFLQDELPHLEWVICKAKKTLKIVRENLILALGVICLATVPALLGYIPLYLAVILHEGGTVIVGLNSLRLLRS